MSVQNEADSLTCELVTLRARCLELSTCNDSLLLEAEIDKKMVVSLKADVKTLQGLLKDREDKLLRSGAAGALAGAREAERDGVVRELEIKLEGARAECKEATQRSSHFSKLYKEAQVLYAESRRTSILKPAKGVVGADMCPNLDQLLAGHEFVPPSLRKPKRDICLSQSVATVKESVLASLDRLGDKFVQMAVKIKTESPPPATVEFRQVFRTNSDGSLSLVSSVPLVKRESGLNEIVTIDSD